MRSLEAARWMFTAGVVNELSAAKLERAGVPDWTPLSEPERPLEARGMPVCRNPSMALPLEKTGSDVLWVGLGVEVGLPNPASAPLICRRSIPPALFDHQIPPYNSIGYVPAARRQRMMRCQPVLRAAKSLIPPRQPNAVATNLASQPQDELPRSNPKAHKAGANPMLNNRSKFINQATITRSAQGFQFHQ